MPGLNDTPYDVTWTSLLEQDDPDQPPLYEHEESGTTIYEGDKYWEKEHGRVITIEDVQVKEQRDKRGKLMDEFGVHVFYDPDYDPHYDPHAPRHYTDDIHYMGIEEFASKLIEKELLPHGANAPHRVP